MLWSTKKRYRLKLRRIGMTFSSLVFPLFTPRLQKQNSSQFHGNCNHETNSYDFSRKKKTFDLATISIVVTEKDFSRLSKKRILSTAGIAKKNFYSDLRIHEILYIAIIFRTSIYFERFHRYFPKNSWKELENSSNVIRGI